MGPTVKEALVEAADLALIVLVPVPDVKFQVVVVACWSRSITVFLYFTLPGKPGAFFWHVKHGHRLVDIVSSIIFEPMDDPAAHRHKIRGLLKAFIIRPADKFHILSRFGQCDRRGRDQEDHNQQQKQSSFHLRLLFLAVMPLMAKLLHSTRCRVHIQEIFVSTVYHVQRAIKYLGPAVGYRHWVVSRSDQDGRYPFYQRGHHP